MIAVLYGFSASVWPCSLFVLLICSFLTSKFGQKKIMNFLAKIDRFVIPKKATEPNGCRFSLTSESRLRRRGVRRAQWLHVFPQNCKSTGSLLESVLDRFCPATLHFIGPDVTDWGVLSPFSFEANLALVLLFSMLEFGSVSCYGCSFVWIFCIRLAMFSFCVTYLFFPDVKIWPKKNHEFFGQI